WGNFYGFLDSVLERGEEVVASQSTAEEILWQEFQSRLLRVEALYQEIDLLQRREIAQVNYQVEQLRLQQRRLEIQGRDTAQTLATIARERDALELQFIEYQSALNTLYNQVNRDSAEFVAANGQRVEVPLGEIVRAYRPNQLSFRGKLALYFSKLTEFLTSEPREANTEGGIFPAIFGTVVMVLLMSVFVTPFGVVAAIYLREYAKQGLATRMIRIAVNNLAGVPSIVYGVFGLGFFIYIVGGEIDRTFYAEALPAPTFGTPGLLWASLTLALLTVPVVIVATEEGLARIPRSLREGSLALGATKFETIVKVIFPIASPAMMTGLILAIARAAGEVAPLMLVGVVKLAPALPVNGIYPYIHLDQKFMHLGYHIYDVGFQSPNVDAARPLVFATALLLVVVIALLNISASALRNRLREKYKALDV
ncbi:MAG: phosphate ABC transporter permease PstA, partial [Pseudomonadales bacterium]|nr:phosphate ABC transporter permease PstA [Pseudomonadales bacterium]